MAAAVASSGGGSIGKGTNRPGAATVSRDDEREIEQRRIALHKGNEVIAERRGTGGAFIADDEAQDMEQAREQRVADGVAGAGGRRVSVFDAIDDIVGRIAAKQTVDDDHVREELVRAGLLRGDLERMVADRASEIRADVRGETKQMHDKAALAEAERDLLELREGREWWRVRLSMGWRMLSEAGRMNRGRCQRRLREVNERRAAVAEKAAKG